jgi:hypothetical protein
MERSMLRSVDSERTSRGIEPRNTPHRGSRCSLGLSDGSIDAPNSLARRSLRGRRAWRGRKGSSRNLGDPVVSTDKKPAGQPANKATAHGRRHLADVGAKRQELGWYRRANEKRGGKGAGSRSALVVPTKRGNRPEGPRGGKGSAGSRNCWRERLRGRRFLRTRSQRNCSG